LVAKQVLGHAETHLSQSNKSNNAMGTFFFVNNAYTR
jgi:hypothetical protein